MAGNRLGFKVTGLQELSAAVANYGREIVADAQLAMGVAVSHAISDAKAAAPVDTGALRNSIKGEVGIDPYGATGAIRASVRYASFVEFGTEATQPKPFLLNAAMHARKRLIDAQVASVARRAPEGLGRPTITNTAGVTPAVGSDA